MAGQHAVGTLGRVARVLLNRLADGTVHLPSLAVQERPIRHLLHQSVAKAILWCRAAALFDDEIEPLEFGKRVDRLLSRDDLLEQREAKRAPDDGRVAQHLAGRGIEAVEARLERCLDDRRYGQLVEVHGEDELAVLPLQCAPFEEIQERLFEEERISSCPNCKHLGDRLGELCAGNDRGQRTAGIVG